jgi:hypothetical protein
VRGSAQPHPTFPHSFSNLHASFMCTAAEEAQKHVRGLEENAVHVKYIELVRAHRTAARLRPAIAC